MTEEIKATLDSFFAAFNPGDRFVFASAVRVDDDYRAHPHVRFDTFKSWGPLPHLRSDYGLADFTFAETAWVDRGALHAACRNGYDELLLWTILRVEDQA